MGSIVGCVCFLFVLWARFSVCGLECVPRVQNEVRARRESVLAAKREAQRKLRHAQEAIGCSTNISQIPPSVAREFLQLPKSVAEITQQVHAEEAKLSCMLPVDSAVEQEYYRRQQAITQLEGDLGSNEAQLAEVAEEMADISGRWLPDLERLLERINQGFQRFFQALGCAGQARCLLFYIQGPVGKQSERLSKPLGLELALCKDLVP
uniref:Secreted protein n=1 Tax=Ixodes ricinus TaxID=34613 RepID=A0A147BDY0_IXORI